MNLMQMLNATVKPLSEHEPSSRKHDRQLAQAAHARKMREDNYTAVETYRAVWQQEWEKTSTIEKRLGYTASACLPTLRRWEEAGLLESRKVVGANGRHKRSMGIEWRWK